MTAADLAAKSCTPCGGGTPPLPSEKVRELLRHVPDWRLAADGKRIVRAWRVKDFAAGLDFFRRIGDVADAEDHHPDLHLANYRDVTVELLTHAAGGLTENDFILAAKIDALSEKG
ncbi:MAG: 4a-hydroxytetrahydrobiopterin dehydratase [Isosphaera sp.]|nr:4a-hydroxytetrahydrobiopterin dehydratase [Isosphaera sp.]